MKKIKRIQDELGPLKEDMNTIMATKQVYHRGKGGRRDEGTTGREGEGKRQGEKGRGGIISLLY